VVALSIVLAASGASNPYDKLSPEERTLLKPQIERWVRDQVNENWADLWEIQDQTAELKNEVLLGRRDAPDMSRDEFAAAMRETIGIGDPKIKAFTVTEVDKERDGFQLVGCASLQREAWKKTSIQYIHVRVVNGKVLFGWPDGSPEDCRL
jgi:hypothetical protein